MRWIPFLVSSLITILLVYALNRPWGKAPAFGKFLSPQHGFWQNAEPADGAFDIEIESPKLKGKTEVYLDDRLVPHIFAENDEDAFFVQGYLHAKFRLWQMDFQTRAAAGRLSEILGPGEKDVLIMFDRNMRRLGMVYAAEIAAEEAKKNPVTNSIIEAYTAGVNHYIDNLKESQLPLEYKLLNYHPEPWSFLKTALFLKYMSFDLAGHEDDFEMTNAKSIFSQADINLLYPIVQDSLDPIIPKGTIFNAAGLQVKIPPQADSLYFNNTDTVSITNLVKPDADNGSNNWAVAGSKTQSGKPILCNDPHLSLNLPSLWFEMQVHTPTYNVYGASFPGAPCVIIGFNDSCAWGFTNGMRDVRDYYQIEFQDESRNAYRFNNEWRNTTWRVDTVKTKGRPDMIDSVAYTLFGPVMFDKSFTENGRTSGNHQYAVRWKGHDPSNEQLMFYGMNKAKNYNDYLEAIQHLHTPGQNCVFASKSGDIAIWTQGEFPGKWYRQGDFVMPGTDSTFMWQGMIPPEETPYQHLNASNNFGRGFVSSANQLPADTTYPYYLGGNYPPYRGLIINRMLRNMSGITPEDMQRLQTENYNVFAEMARPLLLKNIDESALNADEKKYLDIYKNWNLRNDPAEKGITVFANWFDSLEAMVWRDELQQATAPVKWPDEGTLLEQLLRDSLFKFIDDIKTPDTERLSPVVTEAFKRSVPALKEIEAGGKLEWAKFKGTGVRHLLRIPQLSRLNIAAGGGVHIINATKDFHGPSWRMIVHLTDETEAYGIYPGGQSGNPGSKFYDMFVDNWVAGKYYRLWVMKKEEANDQRIIGRMIFTKG
ncbi:MAG TPA: penicillin acylase family protein [Chitinophagaceae bacterium]|nr:penicillin acylase family protein [Chitinophagaceae bacterium]